MPQMGWAGKVGAACILFYFIKILPFFLFQNPIFYFDHSSVFAFYLLFDWNLKLLLMLDQILEEK